jgi:hypothetical protein
MILTNFNVSRTAKILFLAVFVLPHSLCAQLLEFDLLQGKEKIENFKVVSYKNSEEKILHSTAGKIFINQSLILQADSIFISHSFYRNVLDLNRIREKSYHIEEAMELESIVLKSPEIIIVEPRGRKVDGLCNFCRKSISIPTEDLKNKTLKGIELHFPRGKYSASIGGRRVESKSKKFELFISLTNQKDTIYPHQTLFSLRDTLQVKKNDWNYYDLRQYNIDVQNASRIFISIRALDDMVLGRRRIKKVDDNKVITYLDRFKYRNDSIYFIDSRLFAPDLDRISLAYKIHYYDD